MSLFIRTDRNSRLLRAEAAGAHSDIQELSDIQVIMDYLVANPSMNLLFDRRQQTLERDPALSLKVAALIGTRIHEIGPRKFAYVINERQLHHLDQRFCPLLEEHGIDARIYHDLGGALNWLAYHPQVHHHRVSRPGATTLSSRF